MIISAGGVVIKGRTVLLLRNNNGRWVLPKGHVEKDESLRKAAMREVQEESGIKAKIQSKLGWVSYEFFAGGKCHKKKVLWFKMKPLEGELIPQREEGFIDAKYIAFSKLNELNMYESEFSMIKRATREIS